MNNKLLTAAEIADYLGVKQSTIYQWTHQGFIPHIKLGKFVRFKTDQIERWLESRTTTGRKTRRLDLDKLGM